MTDVLLTHSYHLAYDRKQLRKMQPYQPLGTLYAASVLRSQHISVAVFDTMLHDPATGFPAALREHSPRIVAIYEDDFNFLTKMCLTRMREVAWGMVDAARNAGAKVIVHGSDATDHAEDYLQRGADYVLLGEAENTLGQLCANILSQRSVAAIEGLVVLDSTTQKPHRTPPAPKAVSWVDLPEAARDLSDVEVYRRAWTNAHGYFSMNVIASRGCPYRCNWCAKPISGDRFHVRPAEAVAAEILELRDVYGAQHIWFGDDVFALNHHWMQQFAAEMERRQCVLPFKIQSRADLMTAETVTALKRAGCAEVWMGVESGSQQVLDAMDKGLRLSDILEARARLREAGIRACYFLQFGYPGETWSEIQQTVSLVRETRPNDVGISISYPLPNTQFYQRVRAELGSKRNWTDSDDLCAMFTARYTDELYLAIRDALHAEVDSWSKPTGEDLEVAALWQHVAEREPACRNVAPTGFGPSSLPPEPPQFLPLHQLSAAAREA